MLSMTVDLRGAQNFLGRIRKGLEPAVAKVLTRTARQVEQAELNMLESKIDRPTAFTLNSIYLKTAKPGDLIAIVGIKDKQWEYLRTMVLGIPVEKTIVPGEQAKLNVYGNIPGKKGSGLQALMKRKGDFIGRAGPRGTFGAWGIRGASGRGKNRIQGRLHLLGLPARDVKQTTRLPWEKTARDVIDKRWRGNLQQELDKLLRT
jgi:hypothetical protein